MDKFQLRHFDYVLQVPALAAGQRINALVLNLDTDSSFVLRGRAAHCQSATPMFAGQVGLFSLFDRYTGPDEEYLSQDVTRFSNENIFMGQYGSPLPVRPPVIYPPGGVIVVDAFNNGANPINALELYFRGSKIFAPGVLECHTYPEKMSSNPYIYNQLIQALGVSESRPNTIKNIQPDADFVLRAMTIGSMNPAAQGLSQYYQVWLTLRDWDGRPYSNLPVHVDACFGACGSLPNNGSGAMLATDVGPYHPPLFIPEIYVPASRQLILDFVRNDAFVAGAAAVDMRVAMIGSKVYPL